MQVKASRHNFRPRTVKEQHKKRETPRKSALASSLADNLTGVCVDLDRNRTEATSTMPSLVWHTSHSSQGSRLDCV